MLPLFLLPLNILLISQSSPFGDLKSDEAKIYLKERFKVGRDLFLEELAEKGFIGSSQGKISIFQVPFKPIQAYSDIIFRISFPIFLTNVTGMVVISCIIISCKVKDNK